MGDVGGVGHPGPDGSISHGARVVPVGIVVASTIHAGADGSEPHGVIMVGVTHPGPVGLCVVQIDG